MAIGQSKLHQLVNRRRLLSDALIWYDAFDTNLKTTILNWIRIDQLTNQGIDGDGDVIGYYSRLTQFINPSKQFNTPYTLNDTGDFYRSMFVLVFADAIMIEANSSSYNKMQDQEWFTEKILTLTDENIQLLKSILKTKYIEAVRKVLFGN